LTLTGTPGRSSSGDTGPPGPHFNEIVGQTGTGRAQGATGDLGFRRELRDSIQYQKDAAGNDVTLSLSSSNQIGHFLTAAHIGLAVGESEVYNEKAAHSAASFEKAHPVRALIGDLLLGRTQARIETKLTLDAIANAYLKAAVGHELTPDAAGSATTNAATAVLSASSEDVGNFRAGRLDKIKIKDAPGTGNSYQDLLLTYIGFKFGEKVARGEFASPAEAGRYLELMLTDRDLSTVAKSDPFYKDVQEFKQLLEQFKDTQNRIHPSQQQQQKP
jgi:hypothetical protein